MGTLSERILSHSVGREVVAGETVDVSPHLVMMHDSIAPSVLSVLKQRTGTTNVSFPDRLAVAFDHVSPAANLATAEAQKEIRAWVKEQGVSRFRDAGEGIAHQLLVENHWVAPGSIVIGSDSHSTTYGAVGAFGTGMGSTDIAISLRTGRTWLKVPETIRVLARGEFQPGVSVKDLSLAIIGRLGARGATYKAIEYHGLEFLGAAERMTLASMAVEAGAKVGIVPPAGLDESWIIPEWFRGLDGEAVYASTLEIDLGILTPRIARPGHPDDVSDLRELVGQPIDVVYIGTCTNGRHADLSAAARILHGRKVASHVRLIVVPASRQVLQAAISDGSLQSLVDAGAIIGPPGCGACIGRHMGVLAAGEVCLFTGNRNFRGRMGSPEAEIYLVSPQVAALSACLGEIANPNEMISGVLA